MYGDVGRARIPLTTASPVREGLRRDVQAPVRVDSPCVVGPSEEA